jgi:hypothetical protein
MLLYHYIQEYQLRISKTSFVDTLFLVLGVFQAYADEER